MKKYDNFISLGYFCSVALELERIGLRSKSLPFDWLISGFEGVITLIENNFESLFDIDLLLQSDSVHSYYFNEKYSIWFYHDFDKYRSLDQQLDQVAQKYAKRIERFYADIKNPTLFVRYISDEDISDDGISTELKYIENNYSHILSVLKSFNKENDIIFIANEGVNSNIVKIYNVKKDKRDTVARRPLNKNKELLELLMSFDYDLREKNIKFYSINSKKRIMKKICTGLKTIIKDIVHSDYIHNRIKY